MAATLLVALAAARLMPSYPTVCLYCGGPIEPGEDTERHYDLLTNEATIWHARCRPAVLPQPPRDA